METTVPAQRLAEIEKEEMQGDWANYRKQYGPSTEELTTAHKAFTAGWQAGRHGDPGSALH